MIKQILRFIGRSSHNVKVQIYLSLIYGLITLWGVRGTLGIITALKRQAEQAQARKQKRNGA